MFRPSHARSLLRAPMALIVSGFLMTALVGALGGVAQAGRAKPRVPSPAPLAVRPKHHAKPPGPPASNEPGTGTKVGQTQALSRFKDALAMPLIDPMMAPLISNIAHTYRVNNLADTTNCNRYNCTLRGAINRANTDGHSGADMITVTKAGTIKLTSATPLAPTTNMVIVGLGRRYSAVSGEDATGLFNVNGSSYPYPSVEVDGFTLRNGNASDGGAVYIDYASVTLHDDLLLNNHSDSNGGALYVAEPESNLWLTDSTMRRNIAGSYGGGIFFNYGQAVISDTTIGGRKLYYGNNAGSDGGGLYNDDAEIAIYDSHIDYNQATGSGGGIYNCCYTMVMRRGSVSHNLVNSSGYTEGGGIATYDPMQLLSVSVTGNVVKSTSGAEGGGIYAGDYTSLSNSHVDGNVLQPTSSGQYLYGGGVYNSYELAIFGGAVDNNRIENGLGSDYLSGYGGGIYDNDYLSMYDSSASGNKIVGYTPDCSSPCTDGEAYAGGLYNDYQANLDHVRIDSNSILGGSDAYGGGMTYYASYMSGMDHLSLVGNRAESNGYSEGGAIDGYDSLSLSNSTIADTTTIAHGSYGGLEGTVIYNSDDTTLYNVSISNSLAIGGSYLYYGAVYGEEGLNLNHVSITDTTNQITGDGAYMYGGVLYAESNVSAWKDVTIRNTTNVVGLDGSSSESYIYGGVTYEDSHVKTQNVRIRNTSNTVLGGDGSNIYGGVMYDDGYEHNLYRTSITNTKNVVPATNSYIYGGAIYLDSTSTLAEVTVRNTTSKVGGGSSYIYGGAVFNESGYNWQMDQSTVANTLAEATGSGSTIYGGGVYLGSGVEMSNSTFAFNRALTPNATGGNGAWGGALYLDGNATFTNVTMNDNQATTAGGAVYNNGYSAAFKNTVVWNGRCAKNGGGFTSGGHNDGPKSCGFTGPGDFFKKPQLGLLGQHGGFSSTEVPAATSPLVDTGSYSGCPTVDERGVHRPQGPGCDIGAVERRPSDA